MEISKNWNKYVDFVEGCILLGKIGLEYIPFELTSQSLLRDNNPDKPRDSNHENARLIEGRIEFICKLVEKYTTDNPDNPDNPDRPGNPESQVQRLLTTPEGENLIIMAAARMGI